MSTNETIPDVFRAVYARLGGRDHVLRPGDLPGRPLGYLMLYHDRPFAWTDDELGLARSLGDSVATAIGNARLVESVQNLAPASGPSGPVRSPQRHPGHSRIGEAIVAEAKALVAYDTIRVYRVDPETEWCEPIAFQGVFLGTSDPSPEQLRSARRRPDRLGRRAWRGPEHGNAAADPAASSSARRTGRSRCSSSR